jgi:hypothetical protein
MARDAMETEGNGTKEWMDTKSQARFFEANGQHEGNEVKMAWRRGMKPVTWEGRREAR